MPPLSQTKNYISTQPRSLLFHHQLMPPFESVDFTTRGNLDRLERVGANYRFGSGYSFPCATIKCLTSKSLSWLLLLIPEYGFAPTGGWGLRIDRLAMRSVLQSLAMTFVSKIGDKTFFAAAILAMRYPSRLVLAGCVSALVVMTILSATVGWAATNLISRKWTHNITTLLFFGFWLWSLWDAFKEGGGGSEELAEVEAANSLSS